MTAVATIADPTSADPTSVHLGLVELDLLATHAGVPLPFPLRVPSFGRIEAEREVLLAVAGQTLRLRGLADDDGPTGIAAELLTALREHRGTVDLVCSGADGETAVVALVYRASALICRQRLTGDPASSVLLRRVADTALTAELLDFVPELAAARSMPIMLPAAVVDAALRLVKDGTDLEARLRDLVGDHGGDPAVLDELAGLLATPTGGGQLGATRRRDGVDGRAGSELSWLDGPRGRVQVSRDLDGWVSINPLRPDGVRFALDGLATIARK
ncbi:MAG TPA: ESX secretion-associated protein EspG [Pseudonocardiaceae bacterium]|jgi:hypothetical protein|nr:ESX secretion-associated protein EspG [Pseudonocardiaceae bacterium]